MNEVIKKIYIGLSLVLALTLVGCTKDTGSAKNVDGVSEGAVETQVKVEGEYYQLSLPFGGGNPEPSELFIRSVFLDDEKTINAKLKSDFDFFEFSFQPLCYVGNYTGNPNFATDKELINQEVNIDSEIKNLTYVYTVELGKRLFNSNPFKVQSGRTLNDDDFVVKSDGEAINILVGSNYASEYELDDVLVYDSVFKSDMEFKIVGFLESGSKFVMEYGGMVQDIVLDDFIVLPFYDIEYAPKDGDEEVHQQIWYSIKNEGYIKPSEGKSFEDLKSEIDTINKKYGLFFEVIEGSLAKISIE